MNTIMYCIWLVVYAFDVNLAVCQFDKMTMVSIMNCFRLFMYDGQTIITKVMYAFVVYVIG